MCLSIQLIIMVSRVLRVPSLEWHKTEGYVSNNINLLQPNGQFGTHNYGGKDHASARYVYTWLSPITQFLFHKYDDDLLDYLNEDGQSMNQVHANYTNGSCQW